MAGTIVVDRIESDASYASTINVAGQITFSNTVNFGAYSGTAPVAGFYLPTTNNLAFTTASTERMRIDNNGNVGIGTTSPVSQLTLAKSNDLVFTQNGYGVAWGGDNGSPRIYGASSGTLSFKSGGGSVAAEIDSSNNFRFNSGYGSVATAYGCRAWVNFNGTGTVAIRGSGNVSSITDNGVGDYTVNFTTAMPDANYSAAMFPKLSTASASRGIFANGDNGNTTQSASSYRFYTVVLTTGAPADTDFVNATFFR